MKKVMVVFGTRPEAIKMASVVKTLKQSQGLQPLICVTAQHRTMLDQVLALFDITVDYDLDVMAPNQDLCQLSAKILNGLSEIIKTEQPDAILVQGDTTTTLCGALAGYYNNIPVGHIEAGLRTGDLFKPYPEEGNRRMVSEIAHWHFPPTENNRQALLKEGLNPERMVVTGNTVIDALLDVQQRIQQGLVSTETKALLEQLPETFILVTGHRRESFGGGFESICRALGRVAEAFPQQSIVYPVHLNPNVQEPVNRYLSKYDNILLIEPQQYETFVSLMERSVLVLTDSGGVQEEAPSLGKPVLVMRDKTERTEALDAGVRLVGTHEDTIFDFVSRLLTDQAFYQQMATAANPYGDGHAAEKIIGVLAQEL